MMKNFRKKLPKRKLYSEYVRMMNGYFGLSKREAEVYSFMLMLDTEWKPLSDRDYKNILGTTNRSLIIRECNINKTNLSRLVASLKEKGLLINNTHGGYEIPSDISIDSNALIIETVFTFEIIDDEGTRQNN